MRINSWWRKIPPTCFHLSEKGGAKRLIRTGRITQSMNQRSHVEARSPTTNGTRRSRYRALDFLNGQLAIRPGVKPFVGIDQVEKAMRHALSLFHRRLIGGNIHPAIDLARIGRQQIRFQAAGQLEPDLAFSHGGRPDQHDQRPL